MPQLYETITSNNPTLKDYSRVKLSDYYLNLGGSICDFTSYLAVLEVEDKNSIYFSWHWYLIEKLKNIHPEKVSEVLLKIIRDPDQSHNRTTAAEYLIELRRIEGMEYCIEHINKHKEIPFENKWASFQMQIKNMPLPETIEVLFSLLHLCIANNITNKISASPSIDESIYTSLITVSQTDYTIYNAIKERVSKLITSLDEEWFLDSLKYFSERLTQRFYESQTQIINVEEANRIYKSIALKE